ncbi:MAG: GNAT family N-acetyltransferase [Chloroflexota bacterium]|nr:GNAT family N-acetyltransferase [Chloroflexota bacterium]
MNIRPAAASDQPAITRIIRDAKINPMSLDWHRFIVAEEDEPPAGSGICGRIVGIGQIKVHGDGSRELASIAVISERRRQGIGSTVIRALLAHETGALYLTCRQPLETYYARFGFRRIAREEMPPYFRRIIRLANLFTALSRGGVRIIVMKRDA